MLGAILAAGLVASMPVMAAAPEYGDEPTALAEEEEETPVFEAEPLVVVATGEAEEPGKLPVSVSVITREEIQRSGSLNLMDLLTREPGVWVSRQGGLGFGGSVSIRGFGGSPPTQVAVTVDGHPSQMGIMGHILPSSYLVENVERVEILRGPSGTMHGTMAIGGTINVVTRRAGDESADGTVEATVGSYGADGGQVWVAGDNGTTDYRAQMGRLGTDGDHPFAEYDSNNYSLSLGHRMDETSDLTFRAQRVLYRAFDQQEVAEAYAEAREPEFLEQDFDRQDYDLTFTHRQTAGRTEVKLYRTDGDHEFEDGFHSQDFGEGAHLSHLRSTGRGSIRVGLDLDQYGGDIFSPEALRNRFERDETAAYVLAADTLPSGTEASGGIRWTRPGDFDVEWLPQLGLFHPFQGDWSLFGSVRRGYRTPSFRELYLFGINNPDLQPESAWQFEVGARRALRGKGQLQLGVFRIDAEDLIVLGPRPAEAPPGPPLQLQNAGDVTRFGFEIGAREPVGKRTAAYVSFSYLDPGDIKEQTVGRKLAAGVDHRTGRWLLSLDVEYVADLYDFDQTNTLVRVPAFTVVNARVSYPLARGRRAALVVQNLFDKDYRVDPAYPFPMPGRSVRFDIAQEW